MGEWAGGSGEKLYFQAGLVCKPGHQSGHSDTHRIARGAVPNRNEQLGIGLFEELEKQEGINDKLHCCC